MKTTRKVIAAALIVTFSAGAVFADRSNGPRGRTGGFESTPIKLPEKVRDFTESESNGYIMAYLRCKFAGNRSDCIILSK